MDKSLSNYSHQLNNDKINSRDKEYDFIKGIAIICVILLHSIPYTELHHIYAPWHIWQTMPIFIIVSGVLFAKSRKHTSVFSKEKTYKSILKFAKPALLVWGVQILLIIIFKDINKNYIYEIIKQGGFGSGGYFIYIAIQNLLYGGVYYFILKKYKLKGLIAICLFSISVDFLFFYFSIDGELYRVSATRYAFFFALGLAHIEGLLNFKRIWILPLLAGLSALWLHIIQLYIFDSSPIYPFWYTHTALSGFYAYGLFILITNLYHRLQRYEFFANFLCEIGSISYYIFLMQLSFFWLKRGALILGLYPAYSIYLILTEVMICLIFGYIFSSMYKKYFEI